MTLVDSLGGGDVVLHHGAAVVAIDAEVLLCGPLLHNYVDVAGDQLRDGFALGRLHRVVLVRIVTKI